jgi:two-component system sensor histidine kinase DesK
LTVTSGSRDIADMDQANSLEARTGAVASDPDAAAAGIWRPRPSWSIVFLSYLPFYFIAWFFHRNRAS